MLEESSRIGLWVPGISVFGVAYALSILAARPSANDGTANLYIPVIGPWITLAQCTGCNDAGYSAVVLDGLAQAAGVTLTILGFTLTEKEFVRTYEEVTLTVVPRRFADGSYGVGLFGTF